MGEWADSAAGSGSDIVRISPDGGRTLIATVVRDRDGAPLYFVSHVLPL